MEKSKFGTLNKRDYWQGFLVAFLVAFLTALQQFVANGHLPQNWDEWSTILMFGLSGLITWSLKSLGTNSHGKILKGEGGQ